MLCYAMKVRVTVHLRAGGRLGREVGERARSVAHHTGVRVVEELLAAHAGYTQDAAGYEALLLW